jgi:methyltransferase
VKLTAFLLSAALGFLIAEARVSRRHERRLRARGASLPGGDVYRWMAVLYPGAFLTMGAEGLWRSASQGSTSSEGPSWVASGVLLFLASKALKYWAIRSLGERWSFRVFILPGEPLVVIGPYRYVAHPNYIAVVGELVGTAMMVGAWVSGPIMIAAFGVVLAARIRFESRVLQAAVAREHRE